MTAERVPADEPFFHEWNAYRSGAKRSLARARLFATGLGLRFDSLPPSMMVIGSKGKGAAVTYATLALFSAGFRVGTISSPPFRSNRERIRLNGRALSPSAYDDLSDLVGAVIDKLPEVDDGYLSPAGLYTLAGIFYLTNNDADVLVLEEGLGGVSDEISLINPDVVAVTQIFEEHLGIIGSNVDEIACDLMGIVRPQTRQVWTLPQRPSVNLVIANIAGTRLRELSAGNWREAATAGVPGLSKMNANLGLAAGSAMAELFGQAVDKDLAKAIANRTSLPGRLSVHVITKGARRTTWVADAAISPEGVRAALDWTVQNVGDPSTILAAFPDIKDAVACFGELRGRNVIAATAGESYLTYTQDSAPGPLIPSIQAFSLAANSGPLVLCIGTMSFIGEVIGYLGVETESYW